MNQQTFVQKWRTLIARPDFTEIAYYQQHLMDLCQLVGHPLPAGTDTANPQVHTLTLDDLLTNEGLRTLHNVFFNVETFRPGITPAQVTEEAAARFGRLASHLGRWGNEPYAVAHYLIRLLFCLFAEDIDLLPRGLFSRLVADGGRNPQGFNKKVRALFRAMAVGEPFGADDIAWFNGGLFNDERVIDLEGDGQHQAHGRHPPVRCGGQAGRAGVAGGGGDRGQSAVFGE